LDIHESGHQGGTREHLLLAAEDEARLKAIVPSWLFNATFHSCSVNRTAPWQLVVSWHSILRQCIDTQPINLENLCCGVGEVKKGPVCV